jgi:hypothetical protein
MNPLHLLCVIAEPGGFVGAELTVRATGDCFPLSGYAVEAEAQQFDFGEPTLSLVCTKPRLFVDLDALDLMLRPIPHSDIDFVEGRLARVEIDWSQLDAEKLHV